MERDPSRKEAPVDSTAGHTPPSPLPRQIVRLDTANARQPLLVALAPDAAGRAAVAAHLGIPAVRKLRLEGRLIPEGRRDWRLEAMLGATVVQDCVVTLEPVTTRIDEAVTRRYLADMAPPPPGESEMPEDDTAEPLPAALDLAEVMVEALALALPPFPRVEGVPPAEAEAAPPGAAALEEDAPRRPFAGLRDALGSGED
jgi:uncharacterized metal-binding protein YceD (DUF177 family)